MLDKLLPVALVLSGLTGARADVYINNPRGSNNKLSEQANNAQNQNRLFDSQNNAAGGYQIGDNCKPVCQDQNRNYDASQDGAMQGAMTYYQGSELYIEWFMQHGCGAGHPNVRCQAILQYMCESDNSGLRDGTLRGNKNTAGGLREPPAADEAGNPALGQHEPLDFYSSCVARERNKGLYSADQKVRDDRGATATRQNPSGNAANSRHGLECPEERDYYPYWHPTPWHDIAVLTDEPSVRCEYYKKESQNVMEKGLCSSPEFNNAEACEEAGAQWQQREAWHEPSPDCFGGIASRDNHNGNVRNGQPMYYLWRIPEYAEGRCVLRLRYNITTYDFDSGSIAHPFFEEPEGVSTAYARSAAVDHFFLDSRYNGEESILAQDPQDDFLNLGGDRELQIQVSTNQYGRTFQDRSHSFFIKPRPEEVPSSARIVNYNVRGRRGNIVQTYPSVEYDFVPAELTIEEGTFLHFQWVGSDANSKGNAGNGRQGTDRSNLVQVASRGESVPLPIEKHTLFFDAVREPGHAEGCALVEKFAFLGQEANVQCDPAENDDQKVANCKQLNGASAYFDGGLVQMRQVGEHHVLSTRNSDFSNRSHKATIRVTRRWWAWYSGLAVAVGAPAVCAIVVYLLVAGYALKHPTSWMFSARYRPRVLRYLVRSETLQRRVEERRAHARAERQKFANVIGNSEDAEAGGGTVGGAAGGLARPARLPESQSWWGKGVSCCRRCGFAERGLAAGVHSVASATVFAIGFFGHYRDGFHGSLFYPIAKGAGFVLDMNFAIVMLPTLKSLQTAMRAAGTSREWLPIDDPISFHAQVAVWILVASFIHVASHAFHMGAVAAAPVLQRDPLGLWSLSPEERLSGTSMEAQFVDVTTRCAPITGVLIIALMSAMFLTALPCVRRSQNWCTRRLGGFNLFWRVHMRWPWVYLLLLLHAPARLWIWFFFPALFVAVDRMLLAQRQHMPAHLKEVQLLPRDVVALRFHTPAGFTYQAGQYIHLCWRGEWHPFTLSSAPEEACLSVHIRAPDAYDWCSALRRRLTEGAPEAAAASAGLAYERPKPGAVIQYARCDDPGVATSCCKPVVAGRPTRAAAQPSKLHGERAPPLPEGPSSDTFTPAVSEQQLPADAVTLQLSGPFGAPAQKVWHFNTIMVVGAGIGVTPFASVLRSVQLRTRQREAIAGITSSAGARQLWSGWGGNSTTPASSCVAATGPMAESLERLLASAVAVPTKVYFYWIVRGQEEFDWFYELLVTASEGPAKGIIVIAVFLTGEIELSKVRKLPCASGQFFGRPNWGRIFQQNRDHHKGEHIGVFLCGSPVIGRELAKQSARHSDAPGVPGGTRFSFFQESF